MKVRDPAMQRVVALLLFAVLVVPVSAPFAAAEAWEEDGWLETSMAVERIEAGDEFGCYGMPGLSWASDPGAVATACRDYLTARTPASIWGDAPVSLYTPPGLPATDHTLLGDLGFVVHGDNTGLATSAWHDASDAPSFEEDWYNLGRRGGSLEKEVAQIDLLEAELDAGGLVNMYWIGRVNDATIRHDGDVAEMLLERDDVWFTTWGEAWSTWAVSRCHEFDLTVDPDDNRRVSFTLEDTVACSSSNPEAWKVPTTWRFLPPEGTVVTNVTIDGLPAENLTGVRNTAVGFRFEGNETLLSLAVGQRMDLLLDAPVNRSDLDVLGMAEQWNGLGVAVTIAGHDTWDLFRWSKRFNDEPELRFTWLVIPRDADPEMPWLPWVGLLAAVGTVLAMRHVIRSDDGSSALAPNPSTRRISEEE
ncbi:MAG TPA: hypothetical protein D7I05_07695 [Candidatus Poseidoniales archaeon]|nr:MAG TPA: hypothetical protein D7I05_07695 [Candidatus Poseidoniales archaeon]